MRPISLKILGLLCSVIFMGGIGAHAQNNINPGQLNWSNSPGCTTLLNPYVPASNTCVPFPGLLQTPPAAQVVVQPTVAQPLAVNYVSFGLVNGIPQADQFCGNGVVGGVTQPSCSQDASVKIRAAENYAIANGINQVDATHFSGTQPCSVDMFGSLQSPAQSPINLVVTLGAVHFQCSVEQTITNSAFKLRGLGGMLTQIEYVGSASTPIEAVLAAKAASSSVQNGLEEVSIDGIFFYGDAGNVTDALLLRDVNRSEVSNVYAWGATGCGIHSEGDVTTTFYRDKVSGREAANIGINNPATHTSPEEGLCLDSSPVSGDQTTDGTVVDFAAEYVTYVGWWLRSANSMTFTSGTSEANVYGLLIGAGSKYNNFLGSDFEANSANVTGVDVIDNSGYNSFSQLITSSGCTGACTATVDLTGAAGNDWIVGPQYAQGGLTGPGVYGFLPNNPAGFGAAIPSAATGYLPMFVRGALVYIPYFSTLP
jgi:hypothetical protein